MDAIDSNILQICNELECSFFEPSLNTLEQLTLEDNIEFLIRCLWLIAPKSKEIIRSWKLSGRIFERFQTASDLVDLFKKHNVRGDFGYQTLLYGRTVELRKVFIAVIEKLPKYSASQDSEQSAVSDLLVSVRASLDSSLAWVPEFCRRLKMRREGRLWVPPDNESDVFFFSSSEKPFWDALACGHSRSALVKIIRSSELSDSMSQQRLKPPLREKPRILRSSTQQTNSECLATERETCGHSPSTTELSNRQTCLDGILDSIADKQKALAKVESEIAVYRTKTTSITESLIPSSDDLIAFLMDPELSRAKILTYLEGSEDRMERLEKEFRESRKEIVCELKRLQNQLSQPQDVLKNREVLEKMRCETIRNNQIAEKMKKRLRNTKKRDVDRVLIVRRIMEMTASIQKQNEEINKVFMDTLAVQRELKWLTQTLHRTFGTIEEALFKEVEDQNGERAYKLFGKLHLSCMASVEAIERNGALARQNEELLDLIEIEKQNQFDDQLNRIQADLDVIAKENKKLGNLLVGSSS